MVSSKRSLQLICGLRGPNNSIPASRTINSPPEFSLRLSPASNGTTLIRSYFFLLLTIAVLCRALFWLYSSLCYTMPTFQSKTFRRATTASSSFGERLGAFYRARLTRHPFLLFGLPFMAVIVAGSFALTPAAALRYERYDRKVQQVSKEEAFELGLRGPDGEEGIKRNPRRRIIGDEREEYYVRARLPETDQ